MWVGEHDLLLIGSTITNSTMHQRRYVVIHAVHPMSLQCGVLGSFPFDPMGMKNEDRKLKELKNGRLAMLAFIGFCSQAAVRGLGPIDCLKQHIADPWNNNSE